MKSIVCIASLLFSVSVFSANLTLSQMVGVYTLTPVSQITYLEEGMTIEYKLAISVKQDEFGHNIIGLNELFKNVLPDGSETVLGELKCTGIANMSPEKLITVTVMCNNDKSFEQRINLADVKNPLNNEFTAPIFSSLYGMEVEMKFKKSSPDKK